MAEVSINRFEWLKAVMQSRISATGKNVAAALAVQFANVETGQINPAATTLADFLGVSLATVKRAVRQLAEHGWLARTEGRGAGNRTFYTLRSPGKILPFRSPKRGQKCAAEKESELSLSPEKKGSHLNEKGVRNEPSYIEQSSEQKARAAAPPPGAAEYQRWRFAGNAFDGPVLISFDRHDDLKRWADWLRRERLPELCHMPVLRRDANGRKFFVLPWRRPPDDEHGSDEARAYFAALIEAEGARHAAQ